jgi:hypothetical protein
LYDTIRGGLPDPILAHISGEPDLNAPRYGEVYGIKAFSAYFGAESTWLHEHQAQPVQVINTIVTDERIIAETVVDMVNDAGDSIDLPIAIVADVSSGGIDALRIYHSTWPLTGKHALRPPILQPPATPPDEPPVVKAYMNALSDPPDPDAILSLFIKDGYFREPSGQRYKHVGPAGLADFYRRALADGGISLTHCTATWDGESCAVEFIADGWGAVAMPPQAGMAVYQTTQNATHLQAARVYDDVTPPHE